MLPEGFSVTVVEPQYPVNLGHVARLVKNFGVRKLYLVRPNVDMSVATVYSAHAADVLEKAELTTLEDVRRRNELLIASTAIRAKRKSNLARRTVRPEDIPRYVRSAKSSSLVLGRDTTGLTNEELAMCDVTTVLETGTRYRTLNVAHALAIMLYLASRSRAMARRGSSRTARQIFAENLAALASASRMPAHKVRTMEEAAARMAASSGLTDVQLSFLTGVLRKALVCLSEPQPPSSKT